MRRQTCVMMCIEKILIIENSGGKYWFGPVGGRLEALSMHDSRSRFVIFLFGYPHRLEGGQRG